MNKNLILQLLVVSAFAGNQIQAGSTQQQSAPTPSPALPNSQPIDPHAGLSGYTDAAGVWHAGDPINQFPNPILNIPNAQGAQPNSLFPNLVDQNPNEAVQAATTLTIKNGSKQMIYVVDANKPKNNPISIAAKRSNNTLKLGTSYLIYLDNPRKKSGLYKNGGYVMYISNATANGFTSYDNYYVDKNGNLDASKPMSLPNTSPAATAYIQNSTQNPQAVYSNNGQNYVANASGLTKLMIH